MSKIQARGLPKFPKKTTEEKKEKNPIEPYSLRKTIANNPAPYSVLNPLTSSLSPSAKSNGARIVSEIIIIIQRIGKSGK